MTHQTRLKELVSVLAVSLVSAVGWSVHAQPTNFIVDTFDTDTSANWTRWWGSATQDYSFDPAVDAGGKATSGSLKATIGFDIVANQGDNQFAVQRFFTDPDGNKITLDGSQYTNLVFDLKFDPTSPKRPGLGDFGYFEYGLIPADSTQIWLGAVTATNSNWLHVVVPMDPTLPKIGSIQGIVLKMWAGDIAPAAQNALTGTTVFWVDNVSLVANTNTVAPPAPTLTLQSARPGLNLFASQAGSQYQRQNIRAVTNSGYSWVGSASPVTYALTLSNYPATNFAGFQTHLFLVPGSSISSAETSPDYNEPNLVFLDIQNQANGSATGSFRYKTNEPNANAMVYNANPASGPVGTLASVSSASPSGTWSLAFSQDTNVVLTAPSGVSTNFTLPADAAALFADPLNVYIGVQPNQLANIGQSAVISRFQIRSGPTNSPTVLLDDSFGADGGLDTTNTWQVVAGDPAGVLLVPQSTQFELNWTTPANGFVLQSSSDLSAGSWKDATATFGLNQAVQIYKLMTVLIPQNVPSTNAGFFRLISTNSVITTNAATGQ